MLSFAALALALLTSSGCSDDATTTLDGGADSRAVDATGADAPPPTKLARVCGVLKGPSGQPVQAGDVVVCQGEECRVGESSATGSFCVRVRYADTYLFHILEGQTQGQRSAEVLFPLAVSQAAIDAEAKLDLGDVLVPIIPTSIALDLAQGFTGEVGDGITLQIPGGVTTPPPLVNDVSLGARRVALGDVHAQLLASFAGTTPPVAAVALIPSATTFSKRIGFKLLAPSGPNAPAAGTKLAVYRTNPETGALEADGEAIVAADGTIESAADSGLRGLGWIVLYPLAGGN
jgi:hypothetical protein